MEEYPTDDEALEEIERQKDLQEDVYGDGTPTYQQQSDLFSLFEKIVKSKQSSKIANLDPTKELGDVDISVRDCQRIALLSDTLEHKQFGDFWRLTAEVTLATSASKKGWLTELIVTKREFKERQKTHELRAFPAPPKKGRLFGKKNE